MVDLGIDTLTHGAAMHAAIHDDSGERDVSAPGLLAAAAWAIGLAIGLIALTSGHELLAGVALVLAIISPWFGLAWVALGQRADAGRQQRAATVAADQITSYAGGWPALRESTVAFL
jgi:hypothetical protein